MSRIVVTGRVPDAAIEKLRLEHEVDAWPGPESISPEELLRRVAGADRMTIEEVVRKVLLDEHADVIREAVRAVAAEGRNPYHRARQPTVRTQR